MAADEEHAIERTPLLLHDRRLSSVAQEADAVSIISSRLSKEEQALGETAVGERLPYNDYTTIDWLHDLVSAWASLINRASLLTAFPQGQRFISLSRFA